MENKDYPLDILLKGAGVELVDKKPASLLEDYKQVIQNICKSLSEHSSKDYNSGKTTQIIKEKLIKEYHLDKVLYSEITNFVYGLDDQTLGNYLSNLDKLCRDAQQDTDDKYKAIVLRIYDHSQLAVVQTQNVKEQVAYQIDSEIKNAVETFQKNIQSV